MSSSKSKSGKSGIHIPSPSSGKLIRQENVTSFYRFRWVELSIKARTFQA